MRHRGFTLIELAVVMTVFALIVMAAAPSLGRWLDNTQIRNAAESVQNGLQIARNEAVRRNESISFHLVALSNPAVLGDDCALSGSSASWVVSVSSSAGYCASEPSTSVAPMLVTGQPVGNGSRLTVGAFQADGATMATTVTFSGLGRISNATDAVRQIDVTGPVASGNYRRLRIAISSAGNVRMCDPDVGASNDPRKC